MRSSTKRRRRAKPIATNIINAADRFAAVGAAGPIEFVNTGTFTWWRKFPAEAIMPHAATIAADLDRLSAVQPVLRNALRGDEISAIKLAIDEQGNCHPFGIKTDLIMTALMRCAFDGSATAAVVMANVLRCCAFEHDRGAWITGSWFAFEVPDGSKKKESRAARQLARTVADLSWADVATGGEAP